MASIDGENIDVSNFHCVIFRYPKDCAGIALFWCMVHDNIPNEGTLDTSQLVSRLSRILVMHGFCPSAMQPPVSIGELLEHQFCPNLYEMLMPLSTWR